jgi:hypothetical protein
MLVKTIPRRILALVFLVFLVSSVAISTTGLLLFSSADSLQADAGGGQNTLLVYSSTSRVPETSAIPLSVGPKVSSVAGVISTVPEVTAPVSADGKVVFMRGANLTALAAAQGLTLVSGTWPGPNDNSSVVLGSTLAGALRLAPGSQLSIFSFFENRTYTLTVSGVLKAGAPYDDESLSSLRLAQSLRGFGSGTVTMFSVKVDPASFDSHAMQSAVASIQSSSPSRSPIDLSLLPLSSFSSLSPSSVIDQVLGRSIGVSESVFWAMVAVVAVACLAIVYFGLAWASTEYSSILAVLTSIGLTRGSATVYLASAFALVGVAAGAVGYGVAYLSLGALSPALSERIFFHSLSIQPSSGMLAFALIFPLAAVLLILPVVLRSSRPSG